MTTIAAAALAYLSCGLSVIPIAPDGTKAPTLAWTPYQTTAIAADDVPRLFPPGAGLAVIGGAVSGGLEILDFDHPDAFPRWLERLQEADPDLAQVVAGLPLIETPDEGRHLYYRCSTVGRPQKLARTAAKFRSLHVPGKLKDVLIETKGEGGYVLAPPSPPECHESGRTYRHISGVAPENTPTITPDERETLLAVARMLDEVPATPEPPAPPQRDPGPAAGDRPGDAWAAATDWAAILEPHGWARAGKTGGQDAWRRPGKTRGISATCNGDHFYCHTTSAAPLEAGRAYDKLGLLAALEHQGDIRSAVRALAADGYGDRPQPRQPTTAEIDPFDDEADPFDDPDFYRDPADDDPAADPGPTPDLLLDAVALAAPLPPLDFLLEELGLVAGGGAPHLIAGYGFSGKTLACQAMLLSLAAGRPVWGQYRSRQTYRVAHVDLEQGNRLTRARYQRLARGMGVHLPQLGDSIVAAVMPADLRLTRACAARWRRIMAERDLVVVDSLRAAAAGSDENSSDVRQHLDLLGELADETGCRALVIVHARKPSQDSEGGLYAIRGSSAIYDGADSVLLFGAAKGEPICVQHVKARSTGLLAPDLALVVEDVPVDTELDPDADDATPGLRVAVRGTELISEQRQKVAEKRRQDAAQRDAEALRKVLRGRPAGLSGRMLRSLSGVSRRGFDAAVDVLGREIETVPGPRNSTLHRLSGGQCDPA